jgi:hypothetical protein
MNTNQTQVLLALFAFIWGILNLWWRLNLTPGRVMFEPGTEQWTFGQVLAIALLFAPVMALVEGFFTSESQHIFISTGKQVSTLII